jgi:hypothetical protein
MAARMRLRTSSRGVSATGSSFPKELRTVPVDPQLIRRLEQTLRRSHVEEVLKGGVGISDLQGLMGAFTGGSKNPWGELTGLFSLLQLGNGAGGGGGGGSYNPGLRR